MRKLIIFLTAALCFSCKEENIPVVPIIPEVQPGRRDYVWKEYVLDLPQYESVSLRTIWGSDTNNVYMGGVGSLSTLSAWHFDGSSVSLMNEKFPGCTAIWGTSSTNIWIGSIGGMLWHFNGKRIDWTGRIGVEGYDHVVIENIWGISEKEVYAIGFADYPDDKKKLAMGVIFKYDGVAWFRYPMPDIDLSFHNMRIAENGDFIIQARTIPDYSSVILVWDGKTYKHLYTELGFTSLIGMLLLNKEIYLAKSKIIYKYNNGTPFVWKDFSNSQFIALAPYARSEKDMFVRIDGGLAHFNGYDIQIIYQLPSSEIGIALFLFDREVFLTLYDRITQKSKVLHGKLPNKAGG